jgi:hypothetical protein
MKSFDLHTLTCIHWVLQKFHDYSFSYSRFRFRHRHTSDYSLHILPLPTTPHHARSLSAPGHRSLFSISLTVSSPILLIIPLTISSPASPLLLWYVYRHFATARATFSFATASLGHALASRWWCDILRLPFRLGEPLFHYVSRLSMRFHLRHSPF